MRAALVSTHLPWDHKPEFTDAEYFIGLFLGILAAVYSRTINFDTF